MHKINAAEQGGFCLKNGITEQKNKFNENHFLFSEKQFFQQIFPLQNFNSTLFVIFVV